MRESPPSLMTVKTASAACAPAADSEADLLRSLPQRVTDCGIDAEACQHHCDRSEIPRRSV